MISETKSRPVSVDSFESSQWKKFTVKERMNALTVSLHAVQNAQAKESPSEELFG